MTAPEGYYRTDGARTLAQRFWSGYCDYLCMLNGYEIFFAFLGKICRYRSRLERASQRSLEKITSAPATIPARSGNM